jgi:hypothetical protein
MSLVPSELAGWLDAVLGSDPLEIDRAAGALLRVCREHAGALRAARSVQLDRMLSGAASGLTAWLVEHVAGDWVAPRRVASAVADLWRLAGMHESELGTEAVRAIVARVFAESLDDAVGHRYASLFRRRGEWRVAPGEPFPVVQPDLRRLFDAALTTLPDRREAPIDRTRRLALAPESEGIELAVDLSQAALVEPPSPGAMIGVALPISAPTRELDWTTTSDRRTHPVFHDVRPVASADVAARVEQLLAEACARGLAILVFPELSVDEHALGLVRAALARLPDPPIVVAGSRHVRAGGALRNVATLLTPAGDAVHAKFNPYFAGEQLEDIALVPAEVRAHGLADDCGRLVFSTVVVICKDFLAPGAQRTLESLRATLVLVPAWSQKTANFESDAVGLTGKTQSIVLIANQSDTAALGDEDPAVLILTRPVPSLAPFIIRRSEVSPPDLVIASLSAPGT